MLDFTSYALVALVTTATKQYLLKNAHRRLPRDVFHTVENDYPHKATGSVVT